MEVRLDAQQLVLPPGGVEALRERVANAFEPLIDAVAHLHIVLKDINGPRGGRDKVCVLLATLNGGGQIVVTETRPSLHGSIVAALRNGRRQVRRETRRRRRYRAGVMQSLHPAGAG